MSHALVTGAAGGIGSAVCREFAQRGSRVSGFDLVAADDDVPWDHDTVDLAHVEAVEAAVGRARSRAPITSVVHCAAVQTLAAAGEASIEEWERLLRVNLVILDQIVGWCRSDLVDARGSVVAISSVHAQNTTRKIAPYATSKAALEGWVRAAALDLGPEVRVNAVAPGAVRTAMLTAGFARRPAAGAGAEAAARDLAERVPLRKIADPAVVAALIVDVCVRPSFSCATGSVVTLDGGATAQLATE